MREGELVAGHGDDEEVDGGFLLGIDDADFFEDEEEAGEADAAADALELFV